MACRKQTQTHETQAPPAVKKTPHQKKKNISTSNFIITDSILNEAKNLTKCITKRQQICRIAFLIIQKRRLFSSKQCLGGRDTWAPRDGRGEHGHPPAKQGQQLAETRAGRVRDRGQVGQLLALPCESWATCRQAPACAHLNHLTLTH